MKRYVIEREIPGVGTLKGQQLKDAACKSHTSRRLGCWTAARPPRTGRSSMPFAGATARSTGTLKG